MPPEKTLRAWLSEAPYTLVMSSSFFGMYIHAGMLAALVEAGLPPGEVAGSSAGALISALFAAGMSMDQFLALTDDMAPTDVMKIARPWHEPGGLFSMAYIAAFLENALRSHGLCDRLESCHIPVSVVTFDVLGLKPCAHRKGPLVQTVAASMAVPALFTPVMLHGRPQLDGGVGDMAGVGGIGLDERVLYHHVHSLPLMLPAKPCQTQDPTHHRRAFAVAAGDDLATRAHEAWEIQIERDAADRRAARYAPSQPAARRRRLPCGQAGHPAGTRSTDAQRRRRRHSRADAHERSRQAMSDGPTLVHTGIPIRQNRLESTRVGEGSCDVPAFTARVSGLG